MSRAFTGTVWRIANALPAFISITPCSMAITKRLISNKALAERNGKARWSNLESRVEAGHY